MARQVIYWTHAVAAGHLQERQAAEQALASYNATLNASDLETMTAHPKSQWAETKAWTLFAEGQADAAIALLKPIADVQDKLGKGEVDLPAREMVGDMLRLSGRSDDALQEYRLSLQADPGRFDTLLHAAETAEKLQRSQEAARYYCQLLKNSSNASPPARQTLTHAKGFLARRRTS
jgi:tetratricopeptide (TPR) repeat protein